MASITLRPNGHRWINFTAGDGKRKTIRLGKLSAKKALEIKVKVEALRWSVTARMSCDPEVAKWLTDIGDVLFSKFVAVGLVAPREPAPSMQLAAWIDSCIAARTDVKPATKEVWRQGRLGLVNYFGADCDL